MNKTILKKIFVIATVAIIITSLFSCHPDGPEDFIDYVYDSRNEGNSGNKNEENTENKNENDWSYPTSKPKELWDGRGTEYAPYIIKTAQDLANLSYMVNYGYSYDDTYFKLANDIDLNYGISVNANSYNAKEWTSIGKNSSYKFKGNFDGNHRTINGLYNDSLFGFISDGFVKNLTMGTGYIYDYHAGSIVNFIYETKISNCNNNGTIISSSGGVFGGLVGKMEDSEISSSYNYAKVSSTDGTGGGLAGEMYDSRIYYSYNHADVSSVYGTAGGIVGYADHESSCSGCYNYGYISGSKKGEIVGNKEYI